MLDIVFLLLKPWPICIFMQLTHWGRVTHICVSRLAIIGSDNGLSPDRRQAIIWTNYGILLIGPLGTTFSEILIEVHIFSVKKMQLKMSSGKWRPFCLGLNVLIPRGDNPSAALCAFQYLHERDIHVLIQARQVHYISWDRNPIKCLLLISIFPTEGKMIVRSYHVSYTIRIHILETSPSVLLGLKSHTDLLFSRCCRRITILLQLCWTYNTGRF